MDKNQKQTLTMLTLMNTWMLLIPFYGPFFNKMVLRAGNDSQTAQAILIIAYMASCIGCTYFIKEHLIKRLIAYSLISLIALSTIMWFVPGSQSIIAYVLLGLFSGLMRALFSIYFIYGFKSKSSMKYISLSLCGTYLIACLFKYVVLVFGADLSFILLTFLLLLSIGLNHALKSNELILQASIPERPFPLKLILFIGILLVFAMFCNSLIKSTVAPSTIKTQSGSLFTLQYIPEICTFLLIYLFSKKTDRLAISNFMMIFVGISYLVFILVGRVNSATNIGIGLTIALFDVFQYSIVFDVSLRYGSSYRVLRTVYIAIGSGVFIGEFLSNQLTKYMPGNYTLVAVISLAILMIYGLALPWAGKYINAEFSKSKKIKYHFKKYHLLNMGKAITTESSQDNLEADNYTVLKEKLIHANQMLPENSRLTPRELEVSVYLLERYDYETIAGLLYITGNTLKTHTKNIYQKFNVSRRKELIVIVDDFQNKEIRS